MGLIETPPMREQNGSARYSQFASISDAIQWTRTMSDNVQGTRHRRANEQIGVVLRDRLARYLWNSNYIRTEASAVDEPLPTESSADVAGLQV